MSSHTKRFSQTGALDGGKRERYNGRGKVVVAGEG